MKVLVNNSNQPIINTELDSGQTYGINRDRSPDANWSEWRKTNITSNSISEVEVTPELKIIMIQDISDLYHSKPDLLIDKLNEFHLLESEWNFTKTPPDTDREVLVAISGCDTPIQCYYDLRSGMWKGSYELQDQMNEGSEDKTIHYQSGIYAWKELPEVPKDPNY